MQPCGGGGHSALIFGIHGLVARVVVVVGRAHDVGRQRQRAIFFQQRINIVSVVELQFEKFADTLGHGGVQAAFKYQLGAGFWRFGRADMRQRGVFVQHALNQGFDFAARDLLPEQPRLHYFGVVEHQHVARCNIVRQIWKMPVFNRLVVLRHQQAATAAHGGRVLGNQVFGQVEIEFGNVHGGIGKVKRIL